MITEIIDHAIDLTGSEDKSVLVNYTLPSGDWTISIEAKGPLAVSEWGNLFQTAGSYPLYVLDSQKLGNNPREYGTSSVSNTFFQIPVLDALGQDDWVTITITKSGDLLTYYVNENSYGTVTYSSIPDPYTIGSINGTNLNGNTYDHLFADVANFRVFEGAATEEEVAQLMDTPSDNAAPDIYQDLDAFLTSQGLTELPDGGPSTLALVRTGESQLTLYARVPEDVSGWIYKINEENPHPDGTYVFREGHGYGTEYSYDYDHVVTVINLTEEQVSDIEDLYISFGVQHHGTSLMPHNDHDIEDGTWDIATDPVTTNSISTPNYQAAQDVTNDDTVETSDDTSTPTTEEVIPSGDLSIYQDLDAFLAAKGLTEIPDGGLSTLALVRTGEAQLTLYTRVTDDISGWIYKINEEDPHSDGTYVFREDGHGGLSGYPNMVYDHVVAVINLTEEQVSDIEDLYISFGVQEHGASWMPHNDHDVEDGNWINYGGSTGSTGLVATNSMSTIGYQFNSTAGPELVLIGDATATVIQGQEYTDLGATAYDLDGTILTTATTGDVVNGNDPVGTEFVVLITATSSITGVSSEVERLVTVVLATEDTSEEDDSNSDNGENETQPMEEINMSEFNFGAVDYSGTVTETGGQTSNDTVVSQTGSQTEDWAACKKQAIGSAFLAPGASLCGDLVMGPDAEIYLQDGTSAMSLIKNIDLAFGSLDPDSGVFTPADPASLGITEPYSGDLDPATAGDDDVQETNASQPTNPQFQPEDTTEPTDAGRGADNNRWYLKIVRPGAQVVYKELTPVNDLLDGIGSNGIVSLLAALGQVEDVQEAFIAAFDAEKGARIVDVEKLEAQMSADVSTMVTFVGQMETALRQHILDGDASVVSYVDSTISTLVADVNTAHADDRVAGEFNLSAISLGSCGEFSILSASPLEASRQDITKWMIEVSYVDDAGLRRNDMQIAHEAQIDGDGKMAIDASAGFCSEDTLGAGSIVLNAIYVGSHTISAATGSYTPDDQGDAESTKLLLNGDHEADADPVVPNLTLEA